MQFQNNIYEEIHVIRVDNLRFQWYNTDIREGRGKMELLSEYKKQFFPDEAFEERIIFLTIEEIEPANRSNQDIIKLLKGRVSITDINITSERNNVYTMTSRSRIDYWQVLGKIKHRKGDYETATDELWNYVHSNGFKITEWRIEADE